MSDIQKAIVILKENMAHMSGSSPTLADILLNIIEMQQGQLEELQEEVKKLQRLNRLSNRKRLYTV